MRRVDVNSSPSLASKERSFSSSDTSGSDGAAAAAAAAQPPPPQQQSGAQFSLNDLLTVRQAPQGEESHSPAVSPCLDGLRPQDLRNFPLLSRLISPQTQPPLPTAAAADKVVTSAGTQVFLSESVPVLRRSSQPQQHLPPKSPKSPRSPRLASLGKSRSMQTPPPPGSGGSQVQRAGTPTAADLRLMNTYVNDPQPPPVQNPPPVPVPVPALTGRTRSHPNLINDYVNLDPRSGGIIPSIPIPEKPPPPVNSNTAAEASATAESRQLRLLLSAAHTRLARLEQVEREAAHLQEAYAALARSAEKQAALEGALRRAAERETSALRAENNSLRERLQQACLCANMQARSTEAADVFRLLVEEKDARITYLEQENKKLQFRDHQRHFHLHQPPAHQQHHSQQVSSPQFHEASVSLSVVAAAPVMSPVSDSAPQQQLGVGEQQYKAVMLSTATSPTPPPGAVTSSPQATAGLPPLPGPGLGLGRVSSPSAEL